MSQAELTEPPVGCQHDDPADLFDGLHREREKTRISGSMVGEHLLRHLADWHGTLGHSEVARRGAHQPPEPMPEIRSLLWR